MKYLFILFLLFTKLTAGQTVSYYYDCVNSNAKWVYRTTNTFTFNYGSHKDILWNTAMMDTILLERTSENKSVMTGDGKKCVSFEFITTTHGITVTGLVLIMAYWDLRVYFQGILFQFSCNHKVQ